MLTAAHSRARIDVRVPEYTTAKQLRELGAFARYCILRVERELGECEHWLVDISLSLAGYASRIAVDDHGLVFEEEATGRDGALATWDAMCRLEQRLRERRT